MKYKYTPLEFVKEASIDDLPYGNAQKKAFLALKDKEMEAIQFLNKKDELLNPDYKGPFEELNNWLLKSRFNLYKKMYFEEVMFQSGSENSRIAAADCVIPFLIARLWEKSKQVYKFDEVLEDSLSDINEIRVPVIILDRIPYKTLYIEFNEKGKFRKKYHGAFINIFPIENGYGINILRLRDDLSGTTQFFNFVSENNTKEDAEFVIDKNTKYDAGKYETSEEHQSFVMFLLNSLLYLCAQNAEIRESSITKQTYKPSKVIKNKFSEVHINECGYAFGETIKSEMAKVDHSTAISGSPSDMRKPEAEKIRKPMRAHLRKAHWHHYRTGKGRKDLILHWIAPTLVGSGEKLAVIHKVEK